MLMALKKKVIVMSTKTTIELIKKTANLKIKKVSNLNGNIRKIFLKNLSKI